MRYLIFLPFLLAGCAAFDWGDTFNWGDTFSQGEKSAVQNKYNYCNVPQRLMILRTNAEHCRDVGGHRVDDEKADQLESYYQSLTSN